MSKQQRPILLDDQTAGLFLRRKTHLVFVLALLIGMTSVLASTPSGSVDASINANPTSVDATRLPLTQEVKQKLYELFHQIMEIKNTQDDLMFSQENFCKRLTQKPEGYHLAVDTYTITTKDWTESWEKHEFQRDVLTLMAEIKCQELKLENLHISDSIAYGRAIIRLLCVVTTERLVLSLQKATVCTYLALSMYLSETQLALKDTPVQPLNELCLESCNKFGLEVVMEALKNKMVTHLVIKNYQDCVFGALDSISLAPKREISVYVGDQNTVLNLLPIVNQPYEFISIKIVVSPEYTCIAEGLEYFIEAEKAQKAKIVLDGSVVHEKDPPRISRPRRYIRYIAAQYHIIVLLFIVISGLFCMLWWRPPLSVLTAKEDREDIKLDAKLEKTLNETPNNSLDSSSSGSPANSLEENADGNLDKEVNGELDKNVSGKLDKEGDGKLDKNVDNKLAQ
ncbi:hypothetical protein NEHOM01_1655 [Nematocida homosporus]|uniref:uncharacterized protein n=1 Tax=Nematocida homosporus TaxID=1912981 RepID=UPI00221EF017|nr:uncharacterized protein NEHOM01_1655 [Nematocida homosporus]KAI5186716.1 hypothetical protein NEHOM01_1655 [Nematocida homosporus]